MMSGLVVTPCPGQPKITYLQIAGGVQEKVAGLQISMQDICCVYELEPPQDLCHRYCSFSTDAIACEYMQLCHKQTWYMKYW